MSLLKEVELDALMRVASASKRDALLLRVMLECGLTSGEVVRLKKKHLLEDAVAIEGKRERSVPAPAKLVVQLKRLVESEKSEVFVFSGKQEMLSQRQVQKIVKKHARAAGLDKKVKPHSFRHAFAERFIQKNGDVFALAKILGHFSLAGARRAEKSAESRETKSY